MFQRSRCRLADAVETGIAAERAQQGHARPHLAPAAGRVRIFGADPGVRVRDEDPAIHRDLIAGQASIAPQADAAVRMLLLVVSAVPAGSQVVLVSRADPPVPLARLRADGRLLEVGVDELAMDRREARIMLAGTGLRADASDAVVAASEGWPAGLQLAGLAMRSAHPQRPAGDGDPQPGAVAVSGGERIVVDYLRSEVWSELDEVTLSFLTRTSVLDELTGPLCDAVLDTSGSGTILRELRCSNQMLLPLDSRDDRYRHLHLILDALRSELLRRESSLIPELHRRASSWFEQHGDIGSAISHATRGGDLARTAS